RRVRRRTPRKLRAPERVSVSYPANSGTPTGLATYPLIRGSHGHLQHLLRAPGQRCQPYPRRPRVLARSRRWQRGAWRVAYCRGSRFRRASRADLQSPHEDPRGSTVLAMTRQELLAFMRGQRLAVQASTTPDGAPQAAVVGIVVTDAFEVFFDTLESTRKS